jgi:glycosyltransferase involved in cell wall biosynthesis
MNRETLAQPASDLRSTIPDAGFIRIVMISSFKEGFGGGSGKYGYELARRLATRCEVLMLRPGETTGFVDEERSTGSAPELKSTGGVGSGRDAGTREPSSPRHLLRHFTIASAGKDDVRYPLLTRATVSRLFAALDQFHPDVMHAQEPTPISRIAQHWACLRRVPFVITFHVLPGRELDFGAADRVMLMSFPILRQSILGFIRRFHHRCAAGIMMHEEICRRLGPDSRPARLFILPSVLDLKRFRRCRAAPSVGTWNLSYVGFLSDRKNQLYLLEVMRHLPVNFRLRLIGRALTPGYEHKLRKYASAHGLNNVEFLGQVSNDELLDRLEQTHVFVSASRLEVQAAVINEALASGTPVVGLDNETLDLVDDRVGRRLPAGTPAVEFARRVRQICELPRHEYEEMCRQARARVRRMDWSATVDGTIAAYESLLPGQLEHEIGDDTLVPRDPAPESRLSLAMMMISSLLYALNRRASRGINADECKT